jgi:hypothetical protein
MSKTITIKQALAKPSGEFHPGIYITKSEQAIEDQKTWHRGDPSKYNDLTLAPYWVCTCDGLLFAISDEKDFSDFQKAELT